MTVPARVLITSGRAVFALDLIRAFAARGCTVFIADSWEHQFGSASRHVTESFRVPEPNADPVRYAHALREMIDRHGITHVVPVSEEVFFLAAAKGVLPAHVRVVVDSPEQLLRLHDKNSFNRLAANYGLSVPATERFTDAHSLHARLEEYARVSRAFVLKPVFSRFAARVLFSWSPDFLTRARDVLPSDDDPWVLQDRVRGEEVCTYSVCDRGRLLCHVNYSRSFTAGAGAAVSFEAIEDPRLVGWVENFVQKSGYTGQIAFDFIRDASTGTPYALECNPRGTSGIHLFSTQPDELTDALLFPDRFPAGKCVRPSVGTLGMTTAAAVVLYGLPQVNSARKAREWWRVLFRSRDALFDFSDLGPYWMQFRILFRLFRDSRRYREPMIAVSTRDIEWNGKPIPRGSAEN